jgi:hypothetical protein
MDLEYCGEHHFAACTTERANALTVALEMAVRDAGASVPLQTAAIMFMPEASDLEQAVTTTSLRFLVLVLRENGELAPFLRCIKAGVSIRILVTCTNETLYQSFLNPLSHAQRERYCAPFASRGADADASLHQQQLAAAIAFIEQGAGNEIGAPSRSAP